MDYYKFLKDNGVLLPPKESIIYVGMSGGVDSSVAAVLLKKSGYKVHGIFLDCWDDDAPGCTSKQDKKDALKVCAGFGIPFEVWDFKDEYRKKVLAYFRKEYSQGRTPNPDILCNSQIKFGAFLDKVLKKHSGAYIATGHYARILSNLSDTGEVYLASADDKSKDQSYFLYQLTQDKLRRCVFPNGGFRKEKIRNLARQLVVHNWSKPDSRGLCFVGDVDVREFVKRQINAQPGKVVTLRGDVIGEHKGIGLYTIGQRRGFRVGTHQSAPLYVVGKDVKNNVLVVGKRSSIYSNEFEVENIHMIVSDNYFKKVKKLSVRIRNLGRRTPCELLNFNIVKLHRPEFGIAPGQHAVFYDGDVVLGGGVIRADPD